MGRYFDLFSGADDGTCTSLSPRTTGDLYPLTQLGNLANEFTPPFYVIPDPDYNTAWAVPFSAPWATAIVLAATYLAVLRRRQSA